MVRNGIGAVDQASGGTSIAVESTFTFQQIGGVLKDDGTDSGAYRLATANEFVEEKRLSSVRPPPQFYDLYRMEKEMKGQQFIILRPDRFVFAAVDSQENLRTTAGHLKKLFRTLNYWISKRGAAKSCILSPHPILAQENSI